MTAAEYDVVVVGAGPTGSTLPKDLGRRGVHTLLIEKGRSPRQRWDTCIYIPHPLGPDLHVYWRGDQPPEDVMGLAQAATGRQGCSPVAPASTQQRAVTR